MPSDMVHGNAKSKSKTTLKSSRIDCTATKNKEETDDQSTPKEDEGEERKIEKPDV